MYHYWTAFWMLPSCTLLAAILILPPCQGDDAFNLEGIEGAGDMGMKPCPMFKCPTKYEPVPRFPMKLSSTGCSGGGGMMVMQMGSDDDPVESCCDQRSACYQICGSSKTYCDAEFKKCGAETCDKIIDSAKKKKCVESVQMTEMVSGLTGCMEFDKSQERGCECMFEDEVLDRRKKVLREFYKRNNPKGLKKVDSLAAKADNPQKLVGLFLKLVSKYPQAIEKEQDPQKKYMDSMMSDVTGEEDDDVDNAAESEL